MIQRVLQPGEIEALDQTAIPRIRLPERATVFAARATRLRQLADNNPIAGYLRLMATLADAQHQLLASYSSDGMTPDAIKEAQAHSMPLADAQSLQRDPSWHDVLRQLADRIEAAGAVSPMHGKLLDGLRTMRGDELESAADAVLTLRFAEVNPATAPFFMAALQVVWTDIACRLNVRDVPYLDAAGLCPVCGSMPVGSIVRIGGQFEGYRFLQCGLCANEWHMVRVKCSHCDSTKGIAYHGIKDGSDSLKAESCDECHTYRKIGYQEKDYEFEPLADDLASLTLDLLMSEAGYRRASPNPLLWPQSQLDQDDA